MRPPFLRTEAFLGRAPQDPSHLFGSTLPVALIHTYCAVQPPSMGRGAPVIWAAALEQRNTTSCPTCSTPTNCREGCLSARRERPPSSRLTPNASARARI